MSLATASLAAPVATDSVVRKLEEAEVTSLAQLYAKRAAQHPQRAACRWFCPAEKAWRETTWAELQARAQRYATGLHRAGLIAGDRVALQLPNGPDWLAIDWAAHELGLVVVGLYNEEHAASAAHVLRDSGARLAFLRDAKLWADLAALGRPASLHQVVLASGEFDESADEAGVASLDAWLPEAAPYDRHAPEPIDLATIAYTSGSTGWSKGVMLSHRNLLSNVFACLRAFDAQPEDRVLSTLPLANLFERSAVEYLAVAAGTQLIYGRGPACIAEDLHQQQPTLLVTVPRVYERLYTAVMAEFEQMPVPKRALVRLAIESGWTASQGLRGRLMPTTILRRVGEQFAARLGGALRLAVSGGAPLSPQIARTFTALGVPLMQGYGLTEAGPVVAVNREGDNDPASVGRVLDSVETRLTPEGELLVRGPGVMLGYWRDGEATAEAIDAAGWLHTGDKVSRLETSRLYLTGRIKEIIVTSTGQKVSPTELEQRLRSSPLVDQVMVVGEARPFVGALVLPDARQLSLLREQLAIAADDDSTAARERLEEALLTRLQEQQQDVPAHQQVRRIALATAPWTVANGLMTSTLKLKRRCIAKTLVADIERLYAGHLSPPRTDCSCNAGV